MRRREVVRHPERHGCRLLREGSKHTVYIDPTQRKATTIPKHREINEYPARKICRDLSVPEP